MTLRLSSICARAFGAALVAAVVTAAPIVLTAPAQAQVQVSVEFRNALEPYGRWQRHSRWGEVWIPANRSGDWRPYTVGRWVYTEQWGWYWVEDDEEANWGWVTFHYGRWIADDQLGWAWIPGQEWGPGFVQWRHGKEYVGWAPLGPEEIIVEYRDRPAVWAFVRIGDFATAPRLARVILPPREYAVYVRETVVVNQTVVFSDRRYAVNPGLPAVFVAAAIGRPLRAYEVRPRILAGTVRIPGAIEVRAQDVRNRNFRARVEARETQTVIRPAAQAQAPQPLAAGEKGRLGDNPPRAAREGAAPTTGQAPQQQQPQQGQQLPQQGQQQTPQQQRLGTEGRGAPDQPKQGQSKPEQPKQAPAERSGAQQQQQQKQKPSTEGRGAPDQSKQGQSKPEQPKQAPAERSGAQQRQEQGTQGRGGDKGPSQAAPQPHSQPSATEGRGGGGAANKPAPQQRGGQSAGQGGGTEGRGGPGGPGGR